MKVLFLFVLSVSAFADDVTALKMYGEAKTKFAQRQDPAKVEETLTGLTAALTQAESTEVKYDILILASRAHYWKGERLTKDSEKMPAFELGMERAKAAQALDDSYSEAQYYYAINLGKWAMAKGILASLNRKEELMKAAEAAKERLTRAGEMGETTDNYGPDRTLGRMYFKLPGFAGGSREKALELLQDAVNKGPGSALNSIYLAEVLASGNASEKATARKVLDEVLARDVSSFDPDKGPETTLDLEEAKNLRRQLGN